MRNLFFVVALLVLFAADAPRLFADAKHPCKPLLAACEAMGYVKNGHSKGKGLWADCVDKVVAGQSVPGIVVNPMDLVACQKKRMGKGK